MTIRHKLEDWGILERRPRIHKLGGTITGFGFCNPQPTQPQTIREALKLLWQTLWRKPQ